MYEEKAMTPPVRAEHHSIAEDMSNHICEQAPEHQLEMLSIIKSRVLAERQARLEQAEKTLEYEKGMYQNALNECKTDK